MGWDGNSEMSEVDIIFAKTTKVKLASRLKITKRRQPEAETDPQDEM